MITYLKGAKAKGNEARHGGWVERNRRMDLLKFEVALSLLDCRIRETDLIIRDIWVVSFLVP